MPWALTKSRRRRSTSNPLADDGVTAPKHVEAVLMSILTYILKLFLRQFTCASVGEKKL
jgi:hypothetical protein